MVPAMGLGDLGGDEQAEPRPVPIRCRPVSAHAHEGLEQILLQLGRDRRAAIGDARG